MKNLKFFVTNKAKNLIICLLVVLSCLFTGLGLNGIFGAQKEVAVAAERNRIVAWYKFLSHDTAHQDYTGNYNLTKHSSTNGDNDAYGDGLGFDQSDSTCIAYASSSTYNPLTYYSAGSSFTISLLFYTGTYSGGGNRIISGTSTYNGFALYQGWGDSNTGTSKVHVLFGSSSSRTGYFAIPHESWVRINITYNGTTLNAECKNVTNYREDADGYCTGVISAGTGTGGRRLSWTVSNLNIAEGTNGFTIGNKGEYGFTANGAGFSSGGGQKIADLRFYSGVIDSYEFARINYGDRGRSGETLAMRQFDYRPYCNDDATYDATQAESQRNPLNFGPYNGITYDYEEMATCLSGDKGYLYVRNHGYINAKTGAIINNDFSDYMRESPFSFSIRAKLCNSQYNESSSSFYYVFSTGRYGHAFSMGVAKDRIEFSLGRGYDITESSSLYNLRMRFAGVLKTINTYYWVRATVTYDGKTFTGSVYNEATGEIFDTPTYFYSVNKVEYEVPYDDEGNPPEYMGGSFGGYNYCPTIGAQSDFGAHEDNFTAVSSIGRLGVKIGRLDMYTGVLTDSQKAELTALDDKIQIIYPEASSFEKVAHYEFNDANNLGYDSMGNHHLVNAGGVTKASDGTGVLLTAVDNPGDTSAIQSTGVLYSPTLWRDKGADEFDKYRGNMTISLRAKLKTMASSTEAYSVIATGTVQGFWIGVMGTSVIANINNTPISTEAGVLTSTPEWYRINLKIYFSEVGQQASAELSVVKWETDTKYSKTGTRTSSMFDFSGSYPCTLALGGAVQNGNLTDAETGEVIPDKLVEGGASDGTYSPTVADVRIYTGIINDAETQAINAADAALMKVDTANSGINVALTESITMNYWLKLTGGVNPSLNIDYNNHDIMTKNTIASESFGTNGAYRYLVDFSGMAFQDMNDEIVIDSANFTYQGVNYTLNLNDWARKTINVRSYLENIISTYGDTSDVGKQAIYMLNLGAASQRNVGHDLNDLANKNLTATQKQMTGWVPETDLANINANAIWAVKGEEGNGRLDVIKNISIAAEYDNNLGFIIMVDAVNFGTDYTVQFCDDTGAILSTFSSLTGMIDDRVNSIERKYYASGGVITIKELEKEFRVKVFVGGEQHCYTVRFNFLHLIKNTCSNLLESPVVRYIYSLYKYKFSI